MSPQAEIGYDAQNLASSHIGQFQRLWVSLDELAGGFTYANGPAALSSTYLGHLDDALTKFHAAGQKVALVMDTSGGEDFHNNFDTASGSCQAVSTSGSTPALLGSGTDQFSNSVPAPPSNTVSTASGAGTQACGLSVPVGASASYVYKQYPSGTSYPQHEAMFNVQLTSGFRYPSAGSYAVLAEASPAPRSSFPDASDAGTLDLEMDSTGKLYLH